MHKQIFFFALLFFCGLVQAGFAQAPSRKTLDSLSLALAQDADFIDFNLATLRHGKQTAAKNVTPEEHKAFMQEQRTRLENIGARHPHIGQLNEEARAQVREKAWQVVQVTHQEEIERLKQMGKQ